MEQRNYLRIILAIFSFISIIISINRCQQTRTESQAQSMMFNDGWSPFLEKQMYDMFYAQAERYTKDEKARVEYSNCCVSKIKELFPRGLMATAMNDSIKVAVMKIGADCVVSIKRHMNIWTPEVVEQLKLQFYTYKVVKLMPVEMKKEYVDCLTFAVIAKFPNGLDSAANKDSLKNIILKARKSCLKLVLNKYKQLHQQKVKDSI